MAERVIVVGVRHISESFNERGGEQARDGAPAKGALCVTRANINVLSAVTV